MRPSLLDFPALELSVPAYGFFVALALVLGWLVATRDARADRLPVDKLGTAYVVAALMMLVMCA